MQGTQKALILAIEDVPDTQDLLETLLSSEGYGVVISSDGRGGCQEAIMLLPDLILLDIQLPDMSGYEVCQQLKADRRTCHIPIIFLSALTQSLDLVEAFRSGGVDYVKKPFNIDELLIRVETQLGLRSLQKELESQTELLQRQNLRLQAEIVKRRRIEAEIRFIFEATKAINDSENFQAAISITLTKICRMIGWDFGEAWIPNPEQTAMISTGDWYSNREAIAAFGRQSQSLSFAPNIGLIGRVWSAKTIEIIEDLQQVSEQEFNRRELAVASQLRAAVAVPILARQKVLAVLAFYRRTSTSGTQVSPRIVELVEAIAAQLSSFIQRKKMETELLRLSRLDGLTGVANRRQFDERLQYEWLRLSREQCPLALILCDIDCFKRYNDNYGHLAGDDCLRQVAKAIEGAVKRFTDLVARYGGEEMAIILPNTDGEGALQVAVEIQQAMEQLAIPHAYSWVTSQQVTLSIGASSMVPDRRLCADILIEAADSALYQAKANGRNCIVLARKPGSETEAIADSS